MKKGFNVFLLLVSLCSILGIAMILGTLFYFVLFILECFAM